MSPQSATFVSILSILLINPLNAQTGKDCHFTTCPEPGQVRIDATFDAQNNFIGGCHCGCDPSLYDSSSANYCDNPRQINFNPITLSGDCSCNCPTEKQQCRYPQIWDEIECECLCPSFLTTKSCNSPAMWRADICACTCANGIGSIGGPCIQNAKFIGGNVLPDCTCDLQINNNNNNNIYGIECPGVQVHDAISDSCLCPGFMGSASTCNPPRIWNDANCFCGCVIGSIGGPCVENGNFIEGSIVQSDCICDYGVNNAPTNPNNNPFTVNAVCKFRGEPCSVDEHCCTNICKINGFCW
eukprot:275691_1